MNLLNRFILNLVAGAVILLCIGGAWLGLLAIDSPQLSAQLFQDPKVAADATRTAAGAFILFQALMGIVFAGSLSTLLSIDKNIRSQNRSTSNT